MMSGSGIGNINNANTNSTLLKNAIDSQLFVNCTFDMDYLEITKNETLRKYEENVYLLGNIFSMKLSDDKCNEIGKKRKRDENNENININNNLENNENSDSSLNSSSSHSSCINSDSSDSISINSNDICDIDKLIETGGDINKLDNLLEGNTNTDPNTDNININYPQNESDKSMPINLLINQLSEAVTDISNHKNLLNNNKKSFVDSTGKFAENYQKLRIAKHNNFEEIIQETIQETDDLGILPETFKQFYKNEKGQQTNSELPFDPTNNIIIMPL